MSHDVALRAYLRAASVGGDHVDSCVAAVVSVASDPWQAALIAAWLRGTERREATEDIGLTAALRARALHGAGVIAVVPRGSAYPSPRKNAPWEPTREFAMRMADAARSIARVPVTRACDLGAGVGTVLLAMEAWGVTELVGVEKDPLAAALCRIVVPRARVLNGSVKGPFDVVVTRAATLASAPAMVGPGGGLAAVVPESTLVDEKHAPLRRDWVSRHAIRGITGPERVPGQVHGLCLLAVEPLAGPSTVLGRPAAELLATPYVPLRGR